jgi:hypothetical protein
MRYGANIWYKVEDVANIAGFFASDLSYFVNGQHLLVNVGADVLFQTMSSTGFALNNKGYVGLGDLGTQFFSICLSVIVLKGSVDWKTLTGAALIITGTIFLIP